MHGRGITTLREPEKSLTLSTRIYLTTSLPDPPCHDHWVGDYPNLMAMAEATYKEFYCDHCKIVFDDKFAEPLLQYLNYLALCMSNTYGANLLELLSHTFFYKPMEPMEPIQDSPGRVAGGDGTKPEKGA